MPGIEYVSLSFFPGGGVAGLREMCGHDEQLIGDTDTSTAVQLLDCLLVDTPATALKPGQAKQLTAADRPTFGDCVCPDVWATSERHLTLSGLPASV